jgi:hypothetical protein
MLHRLKAIETKFLGATNHKPARVVATSTGGHRLVVSWDDGLCDASNHTRVAQALAKQLSWNMQYVMGWTKAGAVFVPLHYSCSDTDKAW